MKNFQMQNAILWPSNLFFIALSNKCLLSIPYQREYASTPMANRYLPNIHGPPQYHNSPYNQYYDQSPYRSGHNELRATLDKQTQILEKISKAVNNDHGEVHRNRHRERETEPNDLYAKFSTFEKEMELKMKLMSQRSLLERMQQNQNQHQNYNQNQNQYYGQNIPRKEIVPDNAFTFNQNIPMPLKQEPPSEFKDYLLQFQGYLISHISASASNIIPIRGLS
jgi:hypothetical protein